MQGLNEKVITIEGPGAAKDCDSIRNIIKGFVV
jgi:hypothetical protein